MHRNSLPVFDPSHAEALRGLVESQLAGIATVAATRKFVLNQLPDIKDIAMALVLDDEGLQSSIRETRCQDDRAVRQKLFELRSSPDALRADPRRLKALVSWLVDIAIAELRPLKNHQSLSFPTNLIAATDAATDPGIAPENIEALFVDGSLPPDIAMMAKEAAVQRAERWEKVRSAATPEQRTILAAALVRADEDQAARQPEAEVYADIVCTDIKSMNHEINKQDQMNKPAMRQRKSRALKDWRSAIGAALVGLTLMANQAAAATLATSATRDSGYGASPQERHSIIPVVQKGDQSKSS